MTLVILSSPRAFYLFSFSPSFRGWPGQVFSGVSCFHLRPRIFTCRRLRHRLQLGALHGHLKSPTGWRRARGRDIEVVGIVASCPRRRAQSALRVRARVGGGKAARENPVSWYRRPAYEEQPPSRAPVHPENAGDSRCACAGRGALRIRTVSITRPGCWSAASARPAT